jgi:hypothetical protein
MLNAIVMFAGLCCAMWLAISVVDTIVAIVRREWRFSLKGALILTAVISAALGAFITITR